MAGVNSLGIGSGVLTSDLIDKLREADEKAIIEPIKDKIADVNAKEDAYDLLKGLMGTFQGSTLALDSDSLFLDRSVDGNTDAVSVVAESGSAVQSFSITNVDKAEVDVWNSDAFGSKTDAIAGLGEGTLKINIDGEDYEIDYSATSTLADIRDSINDTASEKMTASILQVGDESYELVLTAKDTNKPMIFTDTNTEDDSLKNKLNLFNIQPAEAATFKYNGVDISRSTNEIDDLISGVTISLNQNQEGSESASIDVIQNTVSIKTEMDLFVTNYNALMTNLKDSTSSDTSSGSVGVFSGDYFVKTISRTITNLVTSEDANGNSLMDYGIELDKNGVMSLNSSTFDKQLKDDPSGLELFFSGDSDTDGIFTKLDDKMDNFLDNSGLMSSFNDGLENSQKSLATQYDRQVKVLDDRYELMTKRFQAYDSMISQMNSSFESLKMTIDALSSDDS